MATKSGGKKIFAKCSISHHFRDKHVFVFYAEIQDGHQKWWKNNFYSCQKTLQILVLLTVFRYAEYRFVLVEKNKIRKEYLATGCCNSYYFRLSNG